MDPEQVVRAFMDDVLNGHNGDHAGQYLAEDMAWHGGTVGTVAGRESVAGLMTAVVTAIPDLTADLQDIVVQGDKVVTRLIVSGTLKGNVLGVGPTDKPVRWDAIDLYWVKDGVIAEEWAAEDFTSFLYTTDTYKAPWIP